MLLGQSMNVQMLTLHDKCIFFCFLFAKSHKVCQHIQSKYKYLNFGEYMLNAIERSEDRPNTLLWIQLQVLLMGIVLYPLGFWWSYLNKPHLILIPQIVNGIGDGLAEPIGVKFGRNHQYKTKAWCSKNLYVRSYQGSAMVLLSGFLALIYVMIAYNEYTLGQFIIALVFVPIIGTIVEAKAPHTLDNPFSLVSHSELCKIGHVHSTLYYFCCL